MHITLYYIQLRVKWWDKVKTLAIEIVNEKSVSDLKPKNSRLRSDDSDTTDYENKEKKTKIIPEIPNFQMNFGNQTCLHIKRYCKNHYSTQIHPQFWTLTKRQTIWLQK